MSTILNNIIPIIIVVDIILTILVIVVIFLVHTQGDVFIPKKGE